MWRAEESSLKMQTHSVFANNSEHKNSAVLQNILNKLFRR